MEPSSATYIPSELGPAPTSVLSVGDADFPAAAQGIAARLWLRGQRASLSTTPRVTVVGSRAATSAGLERAYALGQALAERGALVISGGAIGIDGAAHEGALFADGLSCAVLGTGIDQIYPARHRALFAKLARRGCLLSMFPPESPPRAGQFPKRNRLMAALADLVVVVEAGQRSGTGYTARAASQMGRTVVCFPDSPGAAALFQSGARVVTSVDEVLAIVSQASASLAHAPAGRAPSTHAPSLDMSPQTAGSAAVSRAVAADVDDLNELHKRVLCALSARPNDLGELCAHTGLSAADCAAAVIELELRGHCSRLPGGRYIGHAPLC